MFANFLKNRLSSSAVPTLFHKKPVSILNKFKDKAVSLVSKINFVKDPDHLKEALKKLEALDTFIDSTSVKMDVDDEFIKTHEPPNKKFKSQSQQIFSSIENKNQITDTEFKKPSNSESEDLNNILLHKELNISRSVEFEHSYYRK